MEFETFGGQEITRIRGGALRDGNAAQSQSAPRRHADCLDAHGSAEALAEFLLNARLCPERLHIQIQSDHDDRQERQNNSGDDPRGSD